MSKSLAASLIALVLALAACGDGDEPTAEAPAETVEAGEAGGFATVTDAGDVPRIELGISGESALAISVSATEDFAYAVGDTSDGYAMNATFTLDVALRPGADSVTASIAPSITSIETGRASSVPGRVIPWRWTLDEHGALRSGGVNGEYDEATEALLAVPDLVLVVPAEPVGEGAVWSYPIDDEGERIITVTLDRLTGDMVTVTRRLTLSDPEATLTVESTTTHDRASLLVLSGRSEMDLSWSTEVLVDGEPTVMNGSQLSVRTYEVDDR